MIRYGVFEHNPANIYLPEAAVRVFKAKGRAHSYAIEHNLVDRVIDIEPFPEDVWSALKGLSDLAHCADWNAMYERRTAGDCRLAALRMLNRGEMSLAAIATSAALALEASESDSKRAQSLKEKHIRSVLSGAQNLRSKD